MRWLFSSSVIFMMLDRSMWLERPGKTRGCIAWFDMLQQPEQGQRTSHIPVMESQTHQPRPRPRPRPHHPRPRPRPDHSIPRPPLSRPRPLKSETETETETFKIRHQDRNRDPIFFLSNIFLHKKHHFFH